MIVFFTKPDEKGLDDLNQATHDWTMQAARKECAWVCSDCSCSFPDGMPDECAYGDQRCTDIIKRDKSEALIMPGEEK